jgi:quercetin 2,3-dioxygenase
MYMPGNGVYVQCARGTVTLAGVPLSEGDAVGVWDAEGCEVEAMAPAELVLVEVPMTRGVRG